MLKLIICILTISLGFAVCDNPICFSIENVNIEAGTLDIYMINEVALASFQFELEDILITGASGGSAEAAGMLVSTATTTVVGFSITGTTIPAGEAILTTVYFSNINGNEICFVPDSIGDCFIIILGCNDPEASNYNETSSDNNNCIYDSDLHQFYYCIYSYSNICY